MKIINKYIALFCLVLIACEDDPRSLYNGDELGQFVHFALILDKDETIIEGEIKSTEDYVDRYEHGKFSSINIPVSLTTSEVQTELTVDYSVEAFGDFNAFNIEPNQLSLSSDKPIDTLQLSFINRWDTVVADSIVLTLTNTSNPDVSIGYPFGNNENKQLSILLKDIVLPYTFSANSNFALSGKKGEQFEFSVAFSNGLIASDLENVNLLSLLNTDFDFELTNKPFKTGDTEISFTLTLLEDLDNELKYYACEFELAELEGYSQFGKTTLKFEKLPTNTADNTVNTARHFYDVAYDSFNRLYTLFYMDRYGTGDCKWNKSFQMTFPVPVSSDHPNAVLHEDGNYYHAFQIGFYSPNLGRTVNSFALKSWFDNEYTDDDLSPGFNVPKALEFFPKDGTSDTEGEVSVIKQDLLIASKSGNQYTISIAGEGTYHYEEGSNAIHYDSIFVIEMVLEVTSEKLLGGTIEMPYQFINRNPEKSEYPQTTFDFCFKPVYLE